MTPRITGVLAPVVTPFRADLRPDFERFLRHCRWLLGNGVGLAVFGTNSEANSLSVRERMGLLDELVAAGIDPARLMPGTGTCALTDSIRLTQHAVKLGCAGVLMLPPFYYKGVFDEGLYRSYAAIVDAVADARLRIYLYHIPQVSQVPLSLALIERLVTAYPENIVGVKDSSGNWNNTKAMLDRFAARGFDVFVGSETYLLENMRHGGKGCISATANVNPAAIRALYAGWQGAYAEALQGDLDGIRAAFQHFPLIPALKQAIAHWRRDPEWLRVRPPLVELGATEAGALIDDLEARGFSMPGV
jgi:4-hydroxy-tetrahydrodipicolinate synthase